MFKCDRLTSTQNCNVFEKENQCSILKYYAVTASETSILFVQRGSAEQVRRDEGERDEEERGGKH